MRFFVFLARATGLGFSARAELRPGLNPSPCNRQFDFKRICFRSRAEVSTRLRWYVPQNIPKSLFEDGEERSIASYCTHEEKTNFEGFPKNGCYGNQPQPLEVLFDSTDCNNPCSFTKQG